MKVIRINLMPASRRPSRAPGRIQYLAAAGTLVAVVSGTLYYRGVVAHRADLLADATAKEVRLSEVRARLEEAERVREREEKAAQSERELKNLQGRAWSPVLLEMADLTPDGMTWELLLAGPEGLELKGSTRGMPEVAQFVTAVSASAYVERVDFHEYVEVAPAQRYTFHLTVRLRGEEGEHAAHT